MANQTVETVGSGADRAKIAAAIVVFLAGIIGFYVLADKQPGYVRLGVILVGLAAAVGIAWTAGPFQRLVAFSTDAWTETKRVVWPSKKETWQTTLVVFAFVAAMAIFLWLIDKTIEFTLYDLILGWKR